MNNLYYFKNLTTAVSPLTEYGDGPFLFLMVPNIEGSICMHS